MTELNFSDIEAATARITGRIRPVTVTPEVSVPSLGDGPASRVHFALEHLQYTGTFKARGAQNFIRAHREAGTLPKSGVTIASGGNAGLACAWAAGQEGIPATVFVPTTAPAVKVARLRAYGAEVRLSGTEYAEAAAACEEFVASSGALASHAYDHPFIAAGAGTLLTEIRAALPEVDTVVVSVGGGGLFAGVTTAARHFGIRTVAVEPENCRALSAALEAGEIVDAPVDSVAADSLGARRTSAMALAAARSESVTSLLVDDASIIAARHYLWNDHRLAVEHAAATALAGIIAPEPDSRRTDEGVADRPRTEIYRPALGETVCVVLCGANTDLTTF